MYKHIPDIIKTLSIIGSQTYFEDIEHMELDAYFYQSDLDKQDIDYHTLKMCLNTLKKKDYLVFNPDKKDFSLQQKLYRKQHKDLNEEEYRELVIGTNKIFKTKTPECYFAIVIKRSVWDLISKLKDNYSLEEAMEERIKFDEDTGILRIGKHKIDIASKGKKTAYKIVKYIFKNGKTEQYLYSEIARDVFENTKQTDQIKKAIRDLNTEITENTFKEVKKFFNPQKLYVEISKEQLLKS